MVSDLVARRGGRATCQRSAREGGCVVVADGTRLDIL